MPTVREIFDLRKQGRVEEAYEAIKARHLIEHRGSKKSGGYFAI